MKVCYIAHKSVSLAGGELSLLGLMKNIQKYGVEPILVCDGGCPLVDEAESLGIRTKVIPIKHYTYQRKMVTNKAFLMYPIKRIYNMTQHRKMVEFLTNEKVALLHLNSSVVCHEWAAVAKKCNIPYIWHLREFKDIDHDAVTIGKRYFDSLIKAANKRIAISKSIKDYWEKKLSRPCELVYNGLDKDDYYQQREILGADVIRCVIIARVVAGKGQLEAVKAFKILRDRGIDNVKLTVVGFRSKDTSPYEKEILTYIQSNGLEDVIELKDFTSDVRAVHAENDVGLVCSRAEAFGRVTIEFMLAGLFAIGSNSGGTPELISHEETGLLYQQGSPEDLANQIEWVVRNRNKAKEIAKLAQKKAGQTFTIENTAANIFRIYSEIL